LGITGMISPIPILSIITVTSRNNTGSFLDTAITRQ
jgi:hypothetical protein